MIDYLKISNHPAHLEISKEYNIDSNLLSSINIIFKNLKIRTSFFKNGWKLYNEDEKEFFTHVYGLMYLCSLGSFTSFDSKPEIKDYFEKIPLKDSQIILNHVLVFLNKNLNQYNSKNLSFSNSISVNSHSELFDIFSEKYQNKINDTYNIWPNSKIENCGFTKILNSPIKDFISRNIGIEDYIPSLTKYLNRYTNENNSFVRSLIKFYDNDKQLLDIYRGNKYEEKISKHLDHYWEYLWQGFLLSPTKDASEKVNDVLKYYEKNMKTNYIFSVDIINKWINKEQKEEYKDYFKHILNSLENISKTEDIIFESFPSLSIYLDIKNIQSFYKNFTKEKKFQHPYFFIKKVTDITNKLKNEDTTFFKFLVQSQEAKLYDNDYIGFTFTYGHTNIDKEKIEKFYKNIILKILKEDIVNLDKKSIKILEDEFILNVTIPNLNTTNPIVRKHKF